MPTSTHSIKITKQDGIHLSGKQRLCLYSGWNTLLHEDTFSSSAVYLAVRLNSEKGLLSSKRTS